MILTTRITKAKVTQFLTSYRQLPQIPVYDISGVQFGGTYDGPGGEPLGNSSNPLAVLQQSTHDFNRTWNIQGNAFAEADITKHITAKTAFGGNNQQLLL